jgi:hypothetical protein
MAALLSLGAAFSLTVGGCSDRPLPAPVAIDCAEEAPYDIDVLEDYDTPNYGWYAYGDSTPGALMTTGMVGGAATVEPDGGINYSFTAAIENGGRCGSERSLFLQAHGYEDYGCGWGTYNIGVVGGYMGGQSCTAPDGGMTVCPIDASAWEGLTFWARTYDPNGEPTTKGFTLSIDDKDSYGGGYVPDASTAEGFSSTGVCTQYDAGSLANGAMTYTVINGMGVVGGGTISAEPPPAACGNPFTYPMLTTAEWHLYTIPWSAFHQAAMPNRIPTGFDPSTFFDVRVQAEKESRMALWIDNLGFYRHKQPGEGLDGGVESGIEAGQ